MNRSPPILASFILSGVHVGQGDMRDLDTLLKESKATLDGLAGAETIVHSSYYRTASEYHKVMMMTRYTRGWDRPCSMRSK